MVRASLLVAAFGALLTSVVQCSPATTTTRRTWAEADKLADEFIAELTLKEKAQMVTGDLLGVCDGTIRPIPRLNFSGLCLHDGPAGIRVADLATMFPAGVTIGATWDKDLMYARGYAMGEEFRAKGAHILLGPVAGPIGRHPLGGRNWEGFGVDPYLDGIAMEQTIRGHQDAGVQAVSKHYIANEQETHRLEEVAADGTIVPALSSNLDDRTLHELYLWPFANSVRAGTAGIMCAEQRVNSTYACEDDHTLNTILKGELGFKGYVMSDWFAVHSGVKSIKGGLDMNMPGVLDAASAALAADLPYDQVPSYFGGNLTEAVNNGTLDMSRVDDMVRRIMTPYFLLNQDSSDFPTVDPTNQYLSRGINASEVDPDTIPAARDVRGNHTALSRQIASAGTVLLKNANNILPLRPSSQNISNIAIFGNSAPDTTDGLYFVSDFTVPFRPPGTEIGTLAIGGGSGSGRVSSASDLISPLRAIRDRGRLLLPESSRFRTQYITNNDILALGPEIWSPLLYPFPSICLVFLKTYSMEGFDRPSLLNDWNSTRVVESVSEYCTPNRTIVVTHSPGVNFYPWHERVAAILAAHYPGETSGEAIADVLFGDVNPSGHLTYTIPREEKDYQFLPVVNLTEEIRGGGGGGVAGEPGEGGWDQAMQANFTEGLFIDYRHFDKHEVAPLYPFGHGLSYSSFSFIPDSLTISSASSSSSSSSSVSVSALPPPPPPPPPPSSSSASQPGGYGGGNPSLWEPLLIIKARIVSSSSSSSSAHQMTGQAVPQLYVSLPTTSTTSSSSCGQHLPKEEDTPKKVLRGFEKITLAPGEEKEVEFVLTRRDLSFWSTAEKEWRIPAGEIGVEVAWSAGGAGGVEVGVEEEDKLKGNVEVVKAGGGGGVGCL